MYSYVYYEFMKLHFLQCKVLFEDIRDYDLLECFIQLQILYLPESFIYFIKDSSGYICKNIL